jgi:hypothetical protein
MSTNKIKGHQISVFSAIVDDISCDKLTIIKLKVWNYINVIAQINKHEEACPHKKFGTLNLFKSSEFWQEFATSLTGFKNFFAKPISCDLFFESTPPPNKLGSRHCQ